MEYTKETETIGEWFYYPYTGEWYRFIDKRNKDGLLISRVTERSFKEPLPKVKRIK